MFRAIFEAIGPRGEISASIEFHRLSYPLARVWKCAVREFIERNECEISVAWIEKSNFLSRIWNQPSNPPCLSFPPPPPPSNHRENSCDWQPRWRRKNHLPPVLLLDMGCYRSFTNRLPFFFKSDLMPTRGQRRGNVNFSRCQWISFLPSLPYLERNSMKNTILSKEGRREWTSRWMVAMAEKIVFHGGLKTVWIWDSKFRRFRGFIWNSLR